MSSEKTEFHKFCGTCFTERSTGSSNRNFTFDYCAKCKTQRDFVLKRPKPALTKAADIAIEEQGDFVWQQNAKNDENFEFDDNAATWELANCADAMKPAWQVLETNAKLHSGKYLVDFDIENLGDGQLGIGFFLKYNVGVDYGFFGYLGASNTAWSFDPSTGDVVTATESIQGGLPKLDSGAGLVQLELTLNRTGSGSKAVFIVKETRSDEIELPDGAVVVPAACFLKKGQKVSLKIEKKEE